MSAIDEALTVDGWKGVALEVALFAFGLTPVGRAAIVLFRASRALAAMARARRLLKSAQALKISSRAAARVERGLRAAANVYSGTRATVDGVVCATTGDLGKCVSAVGAALGVGAKGRVRVTQRDYRVARAYRRDNPDDRFGRAYEDLMRLEKTGAKEIADIFDKYEKITGAWSVGTRIGDQINQEIKASNAPIPQLRQQGAGRQGDNFGPAPDALISAPDTRQTIREQVDASDRASVYALAEAEAQARAADERLRQAQDRQMAVESASVAVEDAIDAFQREKGFNLERFAELGETEQRAQLAQLTDASEFAPPQPVARPLTSTNAAELAMQQASPISVGRVVRTPRTTALGDGAAFGCSTSINYHCWRVEAGEPSCFELAVTTNRTHESGDTAAWWATPLLRVFDASSGAELARDAESGLDGEPAIDSVCVDRSDDARVLCATVSLATPQFLPIADPLALELENFEFGANATVALERAQPHCAAFAADIRRLQRKRQAIMQSVLPYSLEVSRPTPTLSADGRSATVAPAGRLVRALARLDAALARRSKHAAQDDDGALAVALAGATSTFGDAMRFAAQRGALRAPLARGARRSGAEHPLFVSMHDLETGAPIARFRTDLSGRVIILFFSSFALCIVGALSFC